MRALSFLFVIPFLLLAAGQAQAKSCSSFVTIESYDEAKSVVTLDKGKGSLNKYFPRPEGATGTKIPSKCRSKVMKQGEFPVTKTGGRLKITQVRENFSGKMHNDPDDPTWLPAKLKELIANKTEVCAVLRPPVGKKEPFGVSAIYLPVTPEELAEIDRLEKQAEDLE